MLGILSRRPNLSMSKLSQTQRNGWDNSAYLRMRKISADLLCPITSPPLERGVLVLDNDGAVLAVEPAERHDPASVEYHQGVLTPGFVNTHCHLELSHMRGLVDTGTGLISFITQVVTRRNAPAEIIEDAVRRAEREMLEGGIVALGDISNTADTFAVKQHGRLRYYTFVELFDFLQDRNAGKVFSDWKTVYDGLNLAPGSAKALVPHAPYSVSPSLFRLINEHLPEKATVSIHNQETLSENQFFLDKTGGFPAFFGGFGISFDDFQPTGKSSLYYALAHLDPSHRTLFVHNTLTTREDIEAAHAWSPNVYWATCANANLYIENRLPDYRAFIETGARLTIGTDSLTSNWQLSILEEMKTIARFQSFVPFDLMLRWATLNGAEALGFEDSLGSFDAGKRPGVLLLEGLGGHQTLQPATKVRRLM